MPFTVAYADTADGRHDFDSYLRLLRNRKIDWTQAQRVAESGVENRWGYVWDDRVAAEAFCEEICDETGDDNWYVRELDAAAHISSGPLMPIVIQLRRQSYGGNFALHPHSRSAIGRRFPQARQASNMTIEFGAGVDLEQLDSSLWDHVAIVLSGLTLNELFALGGYQVYDVREAVVIFEKTPEPVA